MRWRRITNRPETLLALLVVCTATWVYRWPAIVGKPVRTAPRDAMQPATAEATHRVTIGRRTIRAATPPAKLDAERWIFLRAGDGAEVTFTGDWICEELR